MTLDEARSELLSFPGSEEGAHHGHPDFRVGGKIFASLQPDKEVAVLRLPLEMAEGLAETPGRRLVSRFGGMGWLAVEVAGTEAREFSELAEIAWRIRKGSDD